MKWSIKLGRYLGIDVYLHFTFLLLLGFIGLSHWLTGRSAGAALDGVVFFLALFACVLLHEYGHALMARRYGIPTKDITLLPIGGVARLERMPDKPVQELWVALAGPAVNVVIAGALALWLSVTASWEPLSSLSSAGGGFAERLLAVNVFLVLFNLLPAFPMDGGRVLRAFLAMRLDYARATRVAATIGQGMAFVFGFIGLFTNPFLLFIALFVWIGASQEAAAAAMKSSLAGVPVREAMLTEFTTLGPDATLADATRLVLAGSQQDFPILEGGRLVGILTHADLFQALRERGNHVPVTAVMHRNSEALRPEESLEAALTHMHAEKGLTMPVLQRGQLVGLLTAENLGEYFMIRAALGNARRSPPPIPPVMPGSRLTPPPLPSWHGKPA
jgi:Zn-dependent protease